MTAISEGIYVDRNVSPAQLAFIREKYTNEGIIPADVPGAKRYSIATPFRFAEGKCCSYSFYIHPKFEEVGVFVGNPSAARVNLVTSTLISSLYELPPKDRRRAIAEKRFVSLIIQEGRLVEVQVHKNWHKKIKKANALQLIILNSGFYKNPEQEVAFLKPLDSSGYRQVYEHQIKSMNDTETLK